MSSTLTVIVINANIDTCAMLEEYFGVHGWRTASFAAKDVRDGTVAVNELMALRPDVIVFDVAIPYESNWQTAQRLRNDVKIDCPIVVTTTNEAAVRRIVGAVGLVEIVGKPYDLALLRQSILSVLGRGETPSTDGPTSERRVSDRRLGDRRSNSAREPVDSADAQGPAAGRFTS